MRTRRHLLPAGVAAILLGAAGSTALTGVLAGQDNVLLLGGAEVCLLAFILWPFTILPAGIVGGALVSSYVADGRLAHVVSVHAGILAIGCLALVIRRLVLLIDERRARTSLDKPMVAMVVLVVAAAVYGLARGNHPHPTVVAGYEIGIIPAYFFLATNTLTSPSALRKATGCYLAAVAGLAATELTAPGRHGGLLSALTLPPLLAAAAHARGWRRSALVMLIAIDSTDVILSAYRAIWLATGTALLILVLWGSPPVRRAVALTVASCAVLLPLAVMFDGRLAVRASALVDELHQSAGYRLPEAAVGLNVLAARPFIGAGLGQTSPGVYLPDFKVTTVGPTYHVFYVTVLANLGLVGLLVFVWPQFRAVLSGLATRDDRTLAFAALSCGFLAAACFAGPTDGHWELGLLPALTLLFRRRATSSSRPVQRQRDLP